MLPIRVAVVLCVLLPWNIGGSRSSRASRTAPWTSLPTDSQNLACQLQCFHFECDIPPSMNLSLLKYNSTKPCSMSPDRTLCYVRKIGNVSKLILNFQGIHLNIFYSLTITSGNQVIFDDKPCIYERALVHVKVSKSAVSVSSQSCHFEDQLQSRVICRPEQGAPVEQTFHFENATTLRLNGLRPFTKYKCSIHNRYEHLHHSKCISRWSDGGFSTFRTDPAPPSAAPTPLGFLRKGADCHVYFQAVPPAHLNGKIQNYGWQCGELSGNSSETFTFAVDCASHKCVLWARNQMGNGRRSQPLLLQEGGQQPRLQLWSEGSGAVRPVVEGGASRGDILIICNCKKCEDDLPKCISMTTRPLANLNSFRVNLTSHRVALLRNGGSGPVMSDWVSCSYEPGAALRTFNPLKNKHTIVRPLWGDRLEVNIPNAELRCPRAARPINGLKTRRICESDEISYLFFPQSSGKSLMFVISLRPGCELQLSADNKSFVSIYSRKHSTELPPSTIAGLIIGVLLFFALLFLILRYRQVLTNGYRTLCHEPNIRENGANNGYAFPFYAQDDPDGYASMSEDSQTYHPTEDEGTRPVRDEYDYRENYTVQS